MGDPVDVPYHGTGLKDGVGVCAALLLNEQWVEVSRLAHGIGDRGLRCLIVERLCDEGQRHDIVTHLLGQTDQATEEQRRHG
jgi:hypothetical protein